MSWSATPSWASSSNSPTKKWIKRVLMISALVGLVYGVFAVESSPKFRKYVPKAALKSIAGAKVGLAKVAARDLVLESKEIRAKKTLKTDLRKSKFGMIQERQFRLGGPMSAEVKVETISDRKVAGKVYRARGGAMEDQLEVGSYSVIESHGLNEGYDYFIRAISFNGEQIVTVTVTRKLSKKEQDLAMTSRYEAMMEDLAERYLKRVTGIVKKQTQKIERLES